MRAKALYLTGISLIAGTMLAAYAQTGVDQVYTNNSCLGATESPFNLLREKNWDFETAPLDGQSPPFGWTATDNSASTSSELGPLTDLDGNLVQNYFAKFTDGQSLAQVPNPDNLTTSTNYKIEFCGKVVNGQFKIYIGGEEVLTFPTNQSNVERKAESDPFRANLGTASGAADNVILIEFIGSGTDSVGYIDNFALVPSTGDGNENTPTPSPSPTAEQPTLPDRTPPTQVPTPLAGTPTPTPTPKLIAQSVQVIANPPLLTVGPDDVASPAGPRKQSYLNIQVIGSDGKPMPLTSIDPNARIRINIDDKGATENVGYIRSFEIGGGFDQSITDRETDYIDTLQGKRMLAFVPTRSYDGAVRVVVDIEFDSYTDGQKVKKTIRGVAPIVLRTDPKASMIDATGQFNPSQNRRLGRQPGDRGFRPDQRTNLFFRERSE
ncbi:hypothetical protein K8I31_17165, partial [bacterium]|nr:hypothetical protein [bacterium]